MLEAFIPMIKNVLIFIALVVPGYILVKTHAVKQEQSAILSKILMYVGMPFLILSGTLSVDMTGQMAVNLLWAFIISVGITIILFIVSKFLVVKGQEEKSLDGLMAKKSFGMERFCTIFSNNGFLGLPLAAAVFGTNSPIFAYLVVFNIVTNTLLYTLGVYLVSGDKKSIDLKNVLLNPVLIAFILGIILNLVGMASVISEVVVFSDYFKNIVTPISMVILGIKMGGIKFKEMFASWGLYCVSCKKLILIPAISVALCFILHKLLLVDANMVMATFIAFAMPTAGLAPVFADRYNGDVKNATIFTLGTTILSLLTIPLLYLIMCVII